MSHIAFCNIPAIGHVYPTLAIAHELVRRGHRVSYATTEARRTVVEAMGATLRPYSSTRPSDTDPGVRPPTRGGYLNDSMLSFVAEAETTLPQIEAAFGDDVPDLVVYDRMSFAGRVFAEKRGLPTIQSWVVLVSGVHWSLFDQVPPGDPDDPALLAWVERLTAFLAANGVPQGVGEFLAPKPLRHLAYFPREFQYAGERFDESYCFVGPCVRPTEPSSWRPPASGLPVVLVTLGTIYNHNPDFYRTCAEAFEGAPWHVVLAIGERMTAADLGPVPSNVEVHQVVPQLDVLRHSAVLVSQVGMGGVMEAALSGVPLVAVPQTLEQEANAARCEELGVGTRLREVSAAGLREAVERVAADPAMPGRIATLRAQIENAGGTPRAADIVEACLPISATR